MRNSSRISYLIISCLILSIFVYFGRTLVIRYIVEPLTQILWLIIMIFKSVDQEIYWILLIFIVFISGINLFPGRVDQKTPKKYADTHKIEDRVQFWKKIISSANNSIEDRNILQSNLNQLHKDITTIIENDNFEQIQLPPLKKWFWKDLYSTFSTSAIFETLQKKHLIKDNELSSPIDDFLKSIETTLEIKNGSFRNESSDS